MFTSEERKAILFLAVLAMLGMGINSIAKKSSRVETIAFLEPGIGKIDLNSADRDSLMSVPGIGQKLSQRIIEYRKQHGAFKLIDELKDIKGISDYRFGKIRDFFVIRE